MLMARFLSLDAGCWMLDAGLRFLRCLLFQLGAQPTGPLLAVLFVAGFFRAGYQPAAAFSSQVRRVKVP